MNYFYWRQRIPIIIMISYLVNNHLKTKLNKLIGYTIILIASIYMMYSYPMNFWVALEWSIYLIICYWYSLRKKDASFSITYSILSSSFGGWLYEIPYFHPTFMFYGISCPLYIHTQILSGIFIIGMLIKEKVKINRNIVYAFIFFIINEIFFYIRVNYYKQVYIDLFLFSRLGVMILLFSLLTGLKKREVCND